MNPNGQAAPHETGASVPLRRLAGVALFLAVLAVAAWGAASLMFSTYMFYDDEGYVLYSYKNYIQHGGLYRDVYSQYGPAPYAWHELLHRAFGFPITHEAGRLLTLGFWTGAATAAGFLVWRLGRSLVAALFALAATVIYLWPMMSEPSHPGGLIVALTVLGGIGGALLWQSGSRVAFALLNGAVAAALALTKINVGVFYVLSCGAFLALQGEAWLCRRAALRLCLGLFALLPFALMVRLIGTPWVVAFALLFAMGSVALFLVAGTPLENRPNEAATIAEGTSAEKLQAGSSETSDRSRRANGLLRLGRALRSSQELRYGEHTVPSPLPFLFSVSGVVMALAICGAVLLRGSTLADLWEGVVAGPLRHPNAFSMEFRWRTGAWSAAVLSAVLLGWILVKRHRASSAAAAAAARLAADRWVAGLRLALLGGAVLLLSRFPEVSPDTTAFSFLHATLWVALWPLGDGASRFSAAWSARLWIGCVLLGQSLHPYPVPGSQISWGTFLIVPLYTLSWIEAAAWWVQHESRALRLRWAVPALMVFSTAFSLACLKGFDARLHDSEPMRLEGTGPLRLPLTTVATYHAMTTNAVIHGDLLFSAPGMFSLNLWTGLPSPTLANVTHWFALLSESQQRRIIGALVAQPRAVVISHREHAAFLAMIGYPPKGPLWDYVQGEMPVAFRIDDWEFRVHRGRAVTPFLTGSYLRRPASRDGDRLDGRLELYLPALPSREIHAFEVCCLRDARGMPLRLEAQQVRATFQSVARHGSLDSTEQAAPLPWKPDRPARLNLHFAAVGYRLDAQSPVVRLLDVAGRTITFVRLVE